MVTIRLFFSVLIFGLLLSILFPVAQIRWSAEIIHAANGDGGANQTGDCNDVGAEADSEDDSPQETLDGGVVSRVSVSDYTSGLFLAWMSEIPPSTLLAFRLFHPPTSPS